MPKALVIEAEKCVSCGTCVLKCAMAHSECEALLEAVAAEAPPQSRIHLEATDSGGVPVQCRQCVDAPCTMICPVNAIKRDDPDSPVLVDAEVCTGCKLCTLVCPFGVIEMSNAAKLAVKCDQCVSRADAPGTPACAEACPTKAIAFVEVDDSVRQRRGCEDQQVTAELGAHAAAAAGEEKTVACELCGEKAGPTKQIAFARKKLPDDVTVGNVCPSCRRRLTAAAVASSTNQ